MPTSPTEPQAIVSPPRMSPFRGLALRFIAGPVARLLTGADVLGAGKLPLEGPAIVVANHNSHIDTLLLLSVFPARVLHKVRPVAATEYFLTNPALGWFSRRGDGPASRRCRATPRAAATVLALAKAALTHGTTSW